MLQLRCHNTVMPAVSADMALISHAYTSHTNSHSYKVECPLL